ncbi:MAG: VOC family protein [Dehalococcoidia bacterium]|nr:VOC family protein [Dehalococcoidia bacterium]MBK9343430.1 VOC family protein [Dehalococcoidia bacterium]
MKSKLGHIELKIDTANTGFYKELLGFLGWETIWEGEGMLGLGGSDGASLWFGSGANAAVNDYDGRGVNHLGISVDSQADVDAFAAYLSGKGVPALFETPRHRPEFAGAEDQTYYQVMFESPDRILFEVVYSGPKQ